jgi:transcription antitermination factor NusG
MEGMRAFLLNSTPEEMTDVIYEVLVPTERVSEIKKGKKSEIGAGERSTRRFVGQEPGTFNGIGLRCDRRKQL